MHVREISLFFLIFVDIISATDRSVVDEILLNFCEQDLETLKRMAVVCSYLNTQIILRLI